MPYENIVFEWRNIMEEKKDYVVPEIISYTDEEILAELGEAQTQDFQPNVVIES